MTSTAPGIRARRRDETTQRLEEVAIGLFSEHGYDNVTTTQIAEAAGVSPRTFFRHFPGGKDDVMMRDVRDSIIAAAAELLARPPHEHLLTALRVALTGMVARHSQSLSDDLAIRRRRVLEQTPLLQGRAIVELREGQDALIHLVATRLGVDPSRDVRPAVIVGAYLNATQVAMLTSVRGSETPALELLERSFDLLDVGFHAAVGKPAPTD